MTPTVQLRLALGRAGLLGPGRVRLLEGIGETGSIAAAARGMGMSYRRAWLLVSAINQALREPAVAVSVGGRQGGGATLTAAGRALIAEYRAMEREAARALAPRLDRIGAMLDPGAAPEDGG